MVRNGCRPSDGTVIDRLEVLQLFEPVLGHHPAVARVIVTAPVVVSERKVDAEFFRRGFEGALTFRHDFLADAVAGHHGDPMHCHLFSPLRSAIVTAQVSSVWPMATLASGGVTLHAIRSIFRQGGNLWSKPCARATTGSALYP